MVCCTTLAYAFDIRDSLSDAKFCGGCHYVMARHCNYARVSLPWQFETSRLHVSIRYRLRWILNSYMQFSAINFFIVFLVLCGYP